MIYSENSLKANYYIPASYARSRVNRHADLVEFIQDQQEDLEKKIDGIERNYKSITAEKTFFNRCFRITMLVLSVLGAMGACVFGAYIFPVSLPTALFLWGNAALLLGSESFYWRQSRRLEKKYHQRLNDLKTWAESHPIRALCLEKYIFDAMEELRRSSDPDKLLPLYNTMYHKVRYVL